ncbi:hypothetical protein [Bacillus sp. MUM 13]|uniref:SunI/YnzG family protein n=1 Tax=Bacillus sp. MUM 13 TaxID=1678001 RepID=UPI0008F55FF5|nr:hypothetical protein [Bacillus sp. MUM 13]OIK13317.1 hypothetical protein BIV59_06045 [Bacillus sp. MUM 13]
MTVEIMDKEDFIILKWQLSHIEIPKNDILSIKQDDTYAGDPSATVRLGFPYASTDRLLIETRHDKYLVFTNESPKFLRILQTEVK